jgi:hypothetical protein
MAPTQIKITDTDYKLIDGHGTGISIIHGILWQVSASCLPGVIKTLIM